MVGIKALQHRLTQGGRLNQPSVDGKNLSGAVTAIALRFGHQTHGGDALVHTGNVDQVFRLHFPDGGQTLFHGHVGAEHQQFATVGDQPKLHFRVSDPHFTHQIHDARGLGGRRTQEFAPRGGIEVEVADGDPGTSRTGCLLVAKDPTALYHYFGAHGRARSDGEDLQSRNSGHTGQGLTPKTE